MYKTHMAFCPFTACLVIGKLYLCTSLGSFELPLYMPCDLVKNNQSYQGTLVAEQTFKLEVRRLCFNICFEVRLINFCIKDNKMLAIKEDVYSQLMTEEYLLLHHNL